MFERDSRWGEEVIAGQWLLTWAWDAFDQAKLMLRGFSFKCSQRGTLLTLRALDNGRAVVSFISGVYPSDCARIAYRLWSGGGLSWTDDKF
jgi:hypothetical protein